MHWLCIGHDMYSISIPVFYSVWDTVSIFLGYGKINSVWLDFLEYSTHYKTLGYWLNTCHVQCIINAWHQHDIGLIPRCVSDNLDVPPDDWNELQCQHMWTGIVVFNGKCLIMSWQCFHVEYCMKVPNVFGMPWSVISYTRIREREVLIVSSWNERISSPMQDHR